MRTIMVGTDGSAGSDVATKYAAEVAQLLDGSVYAVAVLPEHADAEAAADERDTDQVAAERAAPQAARSWFKAAREACRAAEVELVEQMESGDPAEVLAQQAESADLVVVGAHGLTGDAAQLLGGTTRRLLRSCIKPMLIARAEYRPIERVVVGYDASPDAGHAVALVADLACRAAWEVALVVGAPEQSELAKGAYRAAKLIRSRGVEPEVRLVQGDAPSILFEQGERFQADLIAIGGALQGPLSGFFLGEAWPEVVEQSQLPVLLWR